MFPARTLYSACMTLTKTPDNNPTGTSALALPDKKWHLLCGPSCEHFLKAGDEPICILLDLLTHRDTTFVRASAGEKQPKTSGTSLQTMQNCKNNEEINQVKERCLVAISFSLMRTYSVYEQSQQPKSFERYSFKLGSWTQYSQINSRLSLSLSLSAYTLCLQYVCYN